MDKTREHIQIFSKLSVSWLFVAIWWGFNLFAPLQLHNQVIINDLPFLGIGLLFFIIVGFYKKSSYQSSEKNIYLLCPFFIFLILSCITALYFHKITLSFVLLTTTLLLIAYTIDFYPLKETAWFLFLITIGLVLTSVFIFFVRGRPELGKNFFSSQISYILNIFGQDTSSVSGTLFFHGKKISCDLIKLGVFPWLAFTLGFVIIVIASEGKRSLATIIIGLLMHYLYLLLRFAFISIFIPNVIHAGKTAFNLYFWRVPMLSFSPLILLCFLLILQSDLVHFPLLPEFRLKEKICKRDLPVVITLLLAALFITLHYSFPGFPDHQKVYIVFDEIHSQWEPTYVDFNEEITGTLAENSYHSFVDFLHHFYNVTILINKPFKDDQSLPMGVEILKADNLSFKILNKINEEASPDIKTILILKCITTPFKDAEIDVIRDFVFKGGSLFLIGDHTDVFFMNKNINELSKHFGIKFMQDSIFFIYGGWVITDQENYLLHPITPYLKKFIWATGDTLRLSSPAFPLIYSPFVCFSDSANYFFEDFYGNKMLDSEEVLGSFCLMAGSKYGKGKIVAFTDSTCFNNYLMFTVGRRELIAGINRWFGSEKIIRPFFYPALFLIFCLLIVIIIKKLKLNKIFYLLIIFVPLGIIIGLIISNGFNTHVYSMPKPVMPLPPEVIIDSAHDPAYCLGFANTESFLTKTSYDNFIFTIGRTNYYPRIIHKGKITKNALKDKGGCLIISSPRKGYTKEERENIFDYVMQGGSLLLIEGANPSSTINQIANLFGINFRLNTYRDLVRDIKKQLPVHRRDYKINPAWVDGGEILFDFQDMPIISLLKKGKGLLVIIGDDTIFMNSNHTSNSVSFQCQLIKHIINQDVMRLKSIDWNYLKWQ